MSRPGLILLVNPRARHARAGGWQEAVLAVLADRYAVEVHRTASAAEAAALLPARLNAGATAIAVAGGDGTIQSVTDVVAGTGVPIGVSPRGTGNDFARQHGIPTDPRAAAERILRGRRAEVDVVIANGRRFITVGGLGLVTDVALLANRLRAGDGIGARAAKALGTGVYRISASGKVLLGRIPVRRYEIAADDPDTRAALTLDFEGHGLFLANQRYLGAGIALPGDVSPHDGAFELFRVHTTSRGRLLGALTNLLRRAPVDPAILSSHRVRSARIRVDGADTLLGDGDSLCHGRDFHVRVEPRALSIFA